MKTPDKIKKGLEIVVNGCLPCDCGWRSPDGDSENEAYNKAMQRYRPVYDGYQGATQSENSMHSCTVYGGGELNFDVPPGRYPIVCKSTRGIEPTKEGD